MGARPFETFVLDVGFRKDEPVETESLYTGKLLSFAGIKPVELTPSIGAACRGKAPCLHPHLRGRTRQHPSKGLIDLVLISELSPLDAATLLREIDTTFALRNTHPVPKTLPVPPGEWATPFRRLANEVGAPDEIAKGHGDAAAMLDPILSGEVAAGKWDTAGRHWIASSS